MRRRDSGRSRGSEPGYEAGVRGRRAIGVTALAYALASVALALLCCGALLRFDETVRELLSALD